MGMGQTVKCVFRLTFLLKRAERSLPEKGKAVDHSPSLSPPPSGPYCIARAEMPDHDRDNDDDDCSSLGEDTDVEMGLYTDPHLAVSADAGSGSGSGSSSSKRRLVRVVSWTSIADRASARWTRAQERELAIAEQELARCQKAWSSEQELWLEYIKALLEEKEAHEEFLHHRAKQQGDEQQHFRKAWSRRRSGEEERDPRRSQSRLRRLRRSGSHKRED